MYNKTKTQAYYDKKYATNTEKPVGDEMTLPQLILWICVIGFVLGGLVSMWLTGGVWW